MFELFYASGGHGGPYRTLAEAVERARNVFAATERWIDVREYTKEGFTQVLRVAGLHKPQA